MTNLIFNNSGLPPLIKRGQRDLVKHRQIYIIMRDGQVIYVGDSIDTRDRATSHKYDVIHRERNETGATRYLRALDDQGTTATITFKVIEEIALLPGESPRDPTVRSSKAEEKWMNYYNNLGHPVQNIKGIA